MRSGTEATPHLLLPGLARPVTLLHVAQTEEHADGAISRRKAFLHMQRLPRTAFFVLGEAGAVGETVAERSHIGLARHRAALQVLRQQRVGAADRDVGVIVRSERADPGVHADLMADRAV